MPIKFRCQHCRQALSVTSKKAGRKVACPACRETIRVPTIEEIEAALAARRKSSAQDVESKAASSPKDETPRSSMPSDAEQVWGGSPVERPVAPTTSSEAHADEDILEEAPQDDLDEWSRELWVKAGEPRNPWIDEEADLEEDFHIDKRGLDDEGLDMTPMVDVTFLLLIFFMITAAFSLQKSMQAEPPEPEDEGAAQTTTVEEQEEDSIIVGISDDDELFLDDEPIGGLGALADALRARAAESGTERDMIIEAEPKASFGIVIGVMDIAIQEGFQRIRRMSRGAEE